MNLSRIKNKKIAIIGSSGYIGSALVERLVELGAWVLEFNRGDCINQYETEKYKIDSYVSDFWLNLVHSSEIIFILSGNTSVKFAEINGAESLSSSIDPIIYISNASKNLGLKPKVIYASSVTIYGLGSNDVRLNEKSLVAPLNNYDLHKLFAEHQLKLANQRGLVSGVSVRLANVYGWSPIINGSAERGVLNKVVTRALKGDEIQVYGDGQFLRDYVHISDVIDGFIRIALAENINESVLNLASGNSCKVIDAFQMAADLASLIFTRPVSIRFVEWPENTELTEKRNAMFDIEKLDKVLNWRPKTDLFQGISKMLSQLR